MEMKIHSKSVQMIKNKTTAFTLDKSTDTPFRTISLHQTWLSRHSQQQAHLTPPMYPNPDRRYRLLVFRRKEQYMGLIPSYDPNYKPKRLPGTWWCRGSSGLLPESASFFFPVCCRWMHDWIPETESSR